MDQQTHSMNYRVTNKQKPFINHLLIKKQIKTLKEKSLSSKEPQITCSFLHSEKTLISTPEILSQSNMLKYTMSSNFNDSSLTKNCISLNLTTYEEFKALYPAMLLFAHNKSDKIAGLYHGQSALSLTNNLNTIDFLDIPDLKKIITEIIAKKCDALHTSTEEQVQLLKQIYKKLNDQDLHKKILSKMEKEWPTITEIPLSESTYCQEKRKTNKAVTFVYNSTDQTSNVFLFPDNKKIFHYQQRINEENNSLYFQYADNQYSPRSYTGVLTNLKNNEDKLTINNLMPFREKKLTEEVFSLLSENYLLVHIKDNNLEEYKIIDVIKKSIIKSIPSNNIGYISFCHTNKLFVQTKQENSNIPYSIQLIDIDNNSTITFDNIQAHAFNPEKNILIYYSYNVDESGIVTIYDLTKNNSTTITLDNKLLEASICCHPKNNTFLIAGKTTDNFCKVFLYNQNKLPLKQEIFSFANRKLLRLDWSASGKDILYNTKNNNTQLHEINCFNIKNNKIINLINSENCENKTYGYRIHPQQNVIYLQSLCGSLTIYDLSKKETVASYLKTGFHKNNSGSLRNPMDYLSPDKKFLIIPTKEKCDIITHTGFVLFTVPAGKHRMYWEDEDKDFFDKNTPNIFTIDINTDKGFRPHKKLSIAYHDYNNDENIEQTDLL
jgi:hypothetical protein